LFFIREIKEQRVEAEQWKGAYVEPILRDAASARKTRARCRMAQDLSQLTRHDREALHDLAAAGSLELGDLWDDKGEGEGEGGRGGRVLGRLEQRTWR